MVTNDNRAQSRLASYAMAVAVIDKLAWECALTEREKRKLLDFMAARYGLGKTSIFIK